MGQQTSKYLNKCHVLFEKLSGDGWQFMNKLQIYPLPFLDFGHLSVIPALLEYSLCDLISFHPNLSPSSKSGVWQGASFTQNEMNLHSLFY